MSKGQPRQRKTVAVQAVEDALRANPKIASRTLARLLYRQHPELWPNIEACRTAIRRKRGAQGEKHRACIPVVPEAVRTAEEIACCERWGALIPDPEKSEWKWHDLPEEVRRWLIVADLHCPYHDKKAVATCLQHADGNCDGVLILGDGPDAYQLSWWLRDPRKAKLEEEVKLWCQMLDAFAELKPKRIIWKAGNHEFRLERYLMAKAPELVGLTGTTWPEWCDLSERGVEWVPAECPLRHHHLSLLHGHEWGNRFSNPVNPARGAFLKAHDCTLEAHQHRTSHHTEHTLRDRPISCWSIGCLCDLHPLYGPMGRKWNHGFAYLDAGEDWRVENLRIIDGEVR